MPPGSARAEPARAWAEALPQLPLDTVDGELRQWLAYGKVGVSQFDIDLVEPAVTERALTDADALAVRALLRYGVGGDLEAALAADPTELLARLVQASTGPIPLDAARATAAAHPDDWRAWWLVVRAAPGDVDARDKLCGLGAMLNVKQILASCR